jgi:hypothetical protein
MNIRKVVCRESCEEAYEWIQRDLDDELTDVEKEKLMLHLAACRDCSSLYDRLNSLSTHLAQLPMVEPPYSIVESILPELDRIDSERSIPPIAKEQAAAVELPQRLSRRAIWYRYIGGATAAGLLISAVAFMLNYTNTDIKETALSTSEIARVEDAPGTKAQTMAGAGDDKQAEFHRKQQTEQEGQPAEAQTPVGGKAGEEQSSDNGSPGPNTSGSVDVPTEQRTQGASKAQEVHPEQRQASEQKPKPENPKRESANEPSVQPNAESGTVKPKPDEPIMNSSDPKAAVAQVPESSADNKASADENEPPVDNKKSISNGLIAFVQEDGKQPKKPAKQGIAASGQSDANKTTKQEYFVSKTDSALLVRNADGGIEFVTHTWNEMYNVSYRWIGEKKIVYKLEYIGRKGEDGVTASQPQEWLIDLEKNVERPLYNK